MKNKSKRNKLLLIFISLILILLSWNLFHKNSCLETYKFSMNIEDWSINEGFIDEGKKQLPGANYIIHLEDMDMAWSDEKLVDALGYSSETIMKGKNFDFTTAYLTKEKYLCKFLERIFEKGGCYEFITKRSDGRDILIEVEYKTYLYRREGFMAGKILNHREPTDEELEKFKVEQCNNNDNF